MGEKLKLLQVPEEIDWFASLLRAANVRSFLEIGSKYGLALDRVARTLPVGSRIVSVDLPRGTKDWLETQKSLRFVIDELSRIGYDSHLILGDSTDSSVVEKVKSLGPFDAIFIDANHTMPYITKDWHNYGPMARIVGFHDIAWKRAPGTATYRIDVPEFWESIKGDYRHEERKLDPTGQDNGIGVLWRC